MSSDSSADAEPEPRIDVAASTLADALANDPGGTSVDDPDEAAPEAAEIDDAADAAAPGDDDTDETESHDPLQDIPLETRLEAVLFGATGPLSLARLKACVACEDGREIREALDLLSREYEAGRRAFVLEEVAGGFQLRTRPELAELIEATGRRPTNDKLSPAALETLSIVAYRQPVLRADVESIRGVASGEMLRSLIERDLVKVTGRAELPGSPLLYGTTARFLEEFGLRNLRDLPRDRELLRSPID